MLRSLRWEVSKNARHASFPRAQAYGVEKFRRDNSCSEHSDEQSTRCSFRAKFLKNGDGSPTADYRSSVPHLPTGKRWTVRRSSDSTHSLCVGKYTKWIRENVRTSGVWGYRGKNRTFVPHVFELLYRASLRTFRRPTLDRVAVARVLC